MIGLVAKKIDLSEIDKFNDYQQARLGLVPYMELIDKIAHRPSAEELLERLEKREPFS
jgi:hypothetical protein